MLSVGISIASGIEKMNKWREMRGPCHTKWHAREISAHLILLLLSVFGRPAIKWRYIYAIVETSRRFKRESSIPPAA